MHFNKLNKFIKSKIDVNALCCKILTERPCHLSICDRDRYFQHTRTIRDYSMAHRLFKLFLTLVQVEIYHDFLI